MNAKPKRRVEQKEAKRKLKTRLTFKCLLRDDGICIKVKYEQEIEDEAADMEQETEASFKVCFQQLIEYSKEEGSTEEAYGWVEGDTIHQTFDLTDWPTLVRYSQIPVTACLPLMSRVTMDSLP